MEAPEVEPLAVPAGEQVWAQLQLVVGVRDPNSLGQVTTLKPAFEDKAVLLDVFGNGSSVNLLLLYEALLENTPSEVVAVRLEVVVVDGDAVLLPDGLDLGLLPTGVVEHLHLVGETGRMLHPLRYHLQPQCSQVSTAVLETKGSHL